MLKYGLVGCGRIAVRHAELLGGDSLTKSSLAAVCDLVPEKAQSLGEKYGVPFFTDMHEMMRNVDLDVVSILTESGAHAENVVELAPYGKHLVVEKPMALTLSDADQMILACDKNDVRLFVVKQNRFNKPVLKLREALDEGRFGLIVMGTVRVRWCRPQRYYDQDSWRGTWALDGGVLTNQASHHVDLLEWMLGEPESVFAMSRTALADIEAEDTIVVTVRFKSGALGVIEATTATRPKDLEGSLSILGEKGAVVVGGFAVNELQTWEFAEQVDSDRKVVEEFSVNPPDVYGFGHKSYYEHVERCLLEGGATLVDGIEGRKSLELISAIYESVETKKEVRIRFKPTLCRLGRRAS
ncbi:MAG: Gfo/Idh/MocA family oxidoreductase [Pseudomonadota bacterium]